MFSKRILTPILIFCISVFSLLEINCSDKLIDFGDVNSNYWSGKISPWTLGNRNIEAKVVNSNYYFTAGTGTIDSAGNFSVSFITPPDSVLTRFDSIASFCENNLVVNPTGTMYGFVVFIVRGDSTILGQIIRSSNDSITEGSYWINTIYFDRNVTIGGAAICGTDTVNYDWSPAAGWSAAVVYYSRTSPIGNTTIVTGNEPAGILTWRFMEY